jgi:hypothetical protein
MFSTTESSHVMIRLSCTTTTTTTSSRTETKKKPAGAARTRHYHTSLCRKSPFLDNRRMPNRGSSAPLIKGYLPVRLSLPSSVGDEPDDTFFFVKEHFGADKSTLFVANAPIVPGVQPRVLLKSLLGRYGQVERVTVIENPRQTATPTTLSWTCKDPTFIKPIYSRGRFAHVVFASSKNMKKALRSLTEIMSGTARQLGLVLDRLEVQSLKDETQRLDRQRKR